MTLFHRNLASFLIFMAVCAAGWMNVITHDALIALLGLTLGFHLGGLRLGSGRHHRINRRIVHRGVENGSRYRSRGDIETEGLGGNWE